MLQERTGYLRKVSSLDHNRVQMSDTLAADICQVRKRLTDHFQHSSSETRKEEQEGKESEQVNQTAADSVGESEETNTAHPHNLKPPPT